MRQMKPILSENFCVFNSLRAVVKPNLSYSEFKDKVLNTYKLRHHYLFLVGYVRIRWDDLEYTGFELYDALVEINRYFLKFIPVHRTMPFFMSKLHLCDRNVAQLRESSLDQRKQMLVISGLSILLIRRLFCFNESEFKSQTKTILLRNF